jgi:outer membrane protein
MVPFPNKFMVMRFFLPIFISCQMAFGQSGILENYIREAIGNNLALQQKYSEYERSTYERKEAQGYFYPNLSFNARYTVAEGGRTIDFPVGDLLNPVYQTLNTLTETSAFPEISNQHFYFYRPTEQETKLELRQPLFDPGIYFNVRIRSSLSEARKADFVTYKRFLIGEIQKAWYDHLKAYEILELYEHTRELLEENIRVNERLFENDKITVDVLYRSQSELSSHEQRVAEAIKYNRTTTAYFNYLLNRELDASIQVDTAIQYDVSVPGLQELISMAIAEREELQALENYGEVTEMKEKLNRSSRLPRLIGAVDYGIQGVDYDLSPDDDFFLASLVLQWDLFAGLQRDSRIQQSRIDREIIARQRDETQQLITLEIIERYFDFEASAERIKANRAELTALKKAFEIIQKKYAEGQANLLEFIDARTSLTQAERNLILTRYDHLIKYAALERSACMYPIESEKE